MSNAQLPAYHLQHGETLATMAAFIEGRKQSIELPLNHDKFVKEGLIEHGEPTRFTRKEVYTGLDLAYANAKDGGPQAATSALPEKGTKSGHVRALRTNYTYGKNGSKSANLLLYGLGKHRRLVRKRSADAELEASVKAGTTFSYGDKEYANEHLARKAGCRDVYGPNWWDCDKDVKAKRLASIKLA